MIDDRASLTCGEFFMKCQAFYPLSFIFEINYIAINNRIPDFYAI